MREIHAMRRTIVLMGAFALAAALPLFAGEGAVLGGDSQTAGANAVSVPAGSPMTIEGPIVSRDGQKIVVSTGTGSDVAVVLGELTVIKERKSNPFRGSKKYRADDLIPGLNVQVKGHGESGGSLFANEIRFTQDELKYAEALQTRVRPVENRLGETETRLARSEQNAQHLSGQVEELTVATNAVRSGAKAAQQTADEAKIAAATANTGVRLTNDRITALDTFEVTQSATLLFKVGSSALSPEAKESLDRLASQAKSSTGYVLEVTGYASSDGGQELNRRLSERRAEAVVRYLVDQQDIPLRRIITPFGFGENHPVADNSTRSGRAQNRRVDVRILVSRGLTQNVQATASLGQPIH